MYKNPIDKIINYTPNNNTITLKGGVFYDKYDRELSEQDTSSSSDDDTYYDNIESYIGGNGTDNVRQPVKKFKTIINMLTKKAIEKHYTKYSINEIKVNKKADIKLFIIFDAYQFKKNFEKNEINTNEVFDIIKKNDTLIMMCGNTTDKDFKYSRKTKAKEIFKSYSIPMVGIVTLNKNIKYFEEYDFDKPKDKTTLENNHVLIYKMIGRIICLVKDLKQNLLNLQLFYIKHESDNIKLIEIKDNENILNKSTDYIPLSLINGDIERLFNLIYPKVFKFDLQNS